jgi:drug/metabolite transporter (DMT)-like permease
MQENTSYRHALLIVSATACWGSGTVLSKQVLDRGVAPLTLLAIELAASTLLLGLGAVVLGVRPNWSPTLERLALLGLLNPGVAYALGLLGLVTITASLSVLLWATEPILIMLLAVLLLRERIAAATMIAVGIALAGTLLVLYRPGASGDAIGIGLMVGAVSACAFYTVLTRRLLLDDGSLEVVLVQQGAALCFAVVLASMVWALGITNLGMPTDLATWGLAAASGMVYYGIAFWFFISGLRGVPASVAGSLFPLIPVFGIAAGYLVGDRLSDRQWMGAAMVVLATGAATAYHLTRQTVPPSSAMTVHVGCSDSRGSAG